MKRLLWKLIVFLLQTPTYSSGVNIYSAEVI